jgi:GNAT superfamily N-acetyltransferase
MKRIHRVVVKPDYQGIGIGGKLIGEVGKRYKKDGFRLTLVTSSPAFVHGLKQNKQWVMTRKPSRLQNIAKTGNLAGTTSDARLTASFEYRAENNAA